MNQGDFYNCTTIYMGKYIDLDDPKYDLEDANNLAKAFALWAELDFFDDKRKWLIVKISYVNDIFFSTDLVSVIKIFMQINDYSFIRSVNEQKPIEDDNEQE